MNKDHSVYTQSAADALKAAAAAARKSGQESIGTEHILLGLMRTKGCTAMTILKEFGAEEEKMAELIGELIDSKDAMPSPSSSEYTPRAEGILKNARECASELGMKKTGTEHILLAIVQDVECVAARLLYTMQVDLPGM
ncbi:MAG: ATP-dependent Clp protease ATP-binding subunit ClpC, partial [Lachnospiraceae bacterium]|nr:ATP-dependent Clp protease ATP-binding subunit ClpC [Lachnospiraceae bacterium]